MKSTSILWIDVMLVEFLVDEDKTTSLIVCWMKRK